MTKDQQIKSLKTRLENSKSKYDEGRAEIRSYAVSIGHLRQEMAQLQEEVHEANAVNTRQNTTVTVLNEKLGKLKEVARFFRAQRDRIDAYLSGVLDQVEPVESVKEDTDTYGPPSIERRPTTDFAAPQTNRRRRPACPDPFVNNDSYEIDGRTDVQPYRDRKPEGTQDWEDF